MSKYKPLIIKLLSKDTIKSTNEILNELQKQTKKTINWHLLYRILRDLEVENKVERLRAKAGFFWKKK